MSRRALALAATLATLAAGCPASEPTPPGMDSGPLPGVDGGPVGEVDAPLPPGVDGGPRPDVPGACVPTWEICGDRMDQDCNGRDTSCGDTDRDGIEACRPGEAPPACDCDDARANVYPPFGAGIPGGAETCDSLDNDCNGLVDDSAECCSACAFLGAERDRADRCTAAGTCDCSTAPGDGPCPSGQTCCLSGCVNTDTDLMNCGACQSACTNQSDRCTAGNCRCGANPPCDKARMCGGGTCG